MLRWMKRTDITVHGFRSTFRDGCAESTNFPREVCDTRWRTARRTRWKLPTGAAT